MTHNSFDLPDGLAEFQASMRRLAQDKVKPRARAIDKESAYPAGLEHIGRCVNVLSEGQSTN